MKSQRQEVSKQLPLLGAAKPCHNCIWCGTLVSAAPSPTVRLQEADLDRPLILTAEALTDNLMRMTALLEREGLPELAEAFRWGADGGTEAFRLEGEGGPA